MEFSLDELVDIALGLTRLKKDYLESSFFESAKSCADLQERINLVIEEKRRGNPVV